LLISKHAVILPSADNSFWSVLGAPHVEVRRYLQKINL